MSEAQIEQMDQQVSVLFQQGKFTEAILVAKQLAYLARNHYGADSPHYALSLNILAELYQAIGDFAQALPLYQRALAIVEHVYKGEPHADIAICLNNLAGLYRALGDYNQALPLCQRALAIVEWALGPNHAVYATCLNNLAELYRTLGDFATALPLYQRALAIREQVFEGEPYPEVAGSLNNLAFLYKTLGDFATALPLHQRALAIVEQALGPDHWDVAQSLNNLAGLYRALGDYNQALPLYQRALTIREQLYKGESHPKVALSLNNLAGLYRALGDYNQALPLYQRALAIVEQVYRGESHPDIARSLNNLAVLYHFLGDYNQALPLYRRALAIDQKAYGKDHPEVATTLNNLAELCLVHGDFATALPLYQRALTIREQVYKGEPHPDIAVSLNNLALLYQTLGDFATALPLYQRALAIREQVYRGEPHSEVADSLISLACLMSATGRHGEAWVLLREGVRIRTMLMSRLACALPERQLLTFAQTVETTADAMLTLIWRHLSDNADAVRTALDLMLKRKALALEVTAARHEAALSGICPALQPVFDQLRRVRMEWARATFALPSQATEQAFDAHRRRLKELEERCEVLERDLAREVPEMSLQQRLRAVDRHAVALNLPQDTVLVDFVRFIPYRFEAVGTEPRWDPPRYLAFILPTGQPDAVQMIDLGEAAGIDALIATFRTQVINPTRGRGVERPEADRHPLMNVCRNLHARLFEPLLQTLGDLEDRRLLLSPDGELTLLPFETLLDEEGRFVIETHRLSYVASGRDVLRFGQRLGEPSEALIVADPDFDLCATAPAADPMDAPLREERFATTREGRSRDFRTEVDLFERLSSTRAEGENITALLRQKGVPVCNPWLDREALEAPLKSVRAPLILHLATHGFFETDQARTPEDGSRGLSLSREGVPLPANIENPLLRSGLALAGANALLCKRAPAPQAEDGILTALDVCGMNLYGTELVTLSACDTGVGEVRRGEGVFGLRRAFHQAGAKSLVMSLWMVPDKETQLLMERFYQHLLAGLPKADALRGAQLSLIREMRQGQVQPDICGLAHPFFWAAFICQGDPAPMERGTAQDS